MLIFVACLGNSILSRQRVSRKTPSVVNGNEYSWVSPFVFSVRQLVVVNRNLRSVIKSYLLGFSPICLSKSLSRARSLT